MKIQIKSVPDTAEIKLNNETIVTGGGGNDYDTLINKPKINGVIIEGEKTLDDYGNWKIGEGLKENNKVVSVDTATTVEKDNTRPITSAAVYTTVGNIDVILQTI